MPKKQQTNNQISVDIAVIAEKINNIENAVSDIKKKLEGEIATKEWCEGKYGQTTKQVNGILVAFGLAIVSAIATFVIRGGLK